MLPATAPVTAPAACLVSGTLELGFDSFAMRAVYCDLRVLRVRRGEEMTAQVAELYPPSAAGRDRTSRFRSSSGLCRPPTQPRAAGPQFPDRTSGKAPGLTASATPRASAAPNSNVAAISVARNSGGSPTERIVLLWPSFSRCAASPDFSRCKGPRPSDLLGARNHREPRSSLE